LRHENIYHPEFKAEKAKIVERERKKERVPLLALMRKNPSGVTGL